MTPLNTSDHEHAIKVAVTTVIAHGILAGSTRIADQCLSADGPIGRIAIKTVATRAEQIAEEIIRRAGKE